MMFKNMVAVKKRFRKIKFAFMIEMIEQRFKESIGVKSSVLEDRDLLISVENLTRLCIESLRSGGKIMCCGNGGSAVDSMHLAAELSGRYYFDRPPLNAESLCSDNAFLTAIANDYGYEKVFARLLRAKGKSGDVLIGMSTSGNSKNIVEAFAMAKDLGIKTIAWTGADSSLMDESDILLKVPSNDTPRIQETQMLMGHIICELIEKHFLDKPL